MESSRATWCLRWVKGCGSTPGNGSAGEGAMGDAAGRRPPSFSPLSLLFTDLVAVAAACALSSPSHCAGELFISVALASAAGKDLETAVLNYTRFGLLTGLFALCSLLSLSKPNRPRKMRALHLPTPLLQAMQTGQCFVFKFSFNLQVVALFSSAQLPCELEGPKPTGCSVRCRKQNWLLLAAHCLSAAVCGPVNAGCAAPNPPRPCRHYQ